MFTPWRHFKRFWNDSLASLPGKALQLTERKWVRRGILIVSLLGLIAIPIVLVTIGFDLESIARYGYIGVFLATFISSTTVIFPTPGVAVVLFAAALFNPGWVALAATLGGGLGEFTSYLVGYGGILVIEPKYAQRYKRAEGWMRRYGSVTIFLFALFPFLIFDLVGIVAGTLRFPFWKFMLFTLAGRLPRSFIEAYLGWAILPHIFPFLR